MTDAVLPMTTPFIASDRTGRLTLELDPATGLPIAISARTGSGERRLPLALALRLDTDGREITREPFGMGYADVTVLDQVTRRDEPVRHEYLGQDEVISVPLMVGGWHVDLEYRFRLAAPRLEVQVVVGAPEGAERATLRDLYLDWRLAPGDVSAWRVFASGSHLRPGVPLDRVGGRLGLPDADFTGSGFLVLDQPTTETSLLIWPVSRTEKAESVLSVDGEIATVSIATGLAGRIGPGDRLRWSGVELDLFGESWDTLRPQAAGWFEPLGFAAPNDTAEWVPGISLYEVQIGKSVFYGGWEYSPYPTARDLYEDVGRIAGLGFDVIQIMPRQPFPSYNVYDYHDITLSYGDEEDLRRVVEAAHAHGMRVILDILMHGVIDENMITATADRVRRGPYYPRFPEGADIVANDDFTAYMGHDYLLGWARHIIDFEPHWAGGSPGDHPMAAEHPEWFIRNSDGEIIGVYTKAFDTNNVEWQEYFTGVCLMLMEKLGVDGFRFDAPTYNEVPNWSPATEKRASASRMGAVGHFARLREAIKAKHPGALMYTEPAGITFRETMDLVYNYDEHQLIPAVIRPVGRPGSEVAGPDADREARGVRHARDLASWFREKQASLPRGSMTARHIDSHDSFWWPLPGFKWRREQFGVPATRALTATWGLSGGAFMMFVGGEREIEEDIRRVNRLRHEVPEIRTGESDWDAVTVDNDHVYAVVRRLGDQQTVVLVNLSRDPVSATVGITLPATAASPTGFVVRDLWSATSATVSDGYVWQPGDFDRIEMAFAPYEVRVLRIVPAEHLGN